MTGPGALPLHLPHDDLVGEVRSVLDAALPGAGRIGLGLSGGPDSTALALLIREARGDLDLVGVHVRHGLRDDAGDVAAAEAIAARLGIPLEVRPVVVADGAGPEAAARTARHAAFRAVAVDRGLVAVALGHTAEDRAETLLLNLVRGAGLGGLAALRQVRRVDGLLLVRPLLRLRRADVRGVPAGAGVPVVEDPTNIDPAQRRARARHDVLPSLAALAGGPGDPVATLTRLADLAGDDEAALGSWATEAAAGLVLVAGAVRLVPADELDALPLAVRRRVMRGLLVAARGDAEDLAAADVEAALAADAGTVVAGAVAVERSQGWLVARPAALRRLPTRPIGPDGVALPELGASLVLEPPVEPAGEPSGESAAEPAGKPAREPAAPRAAPVWLPEAQVLRLTAMPNGWSVRGAGPGDRVRAGGRERPLAEVLRAAGVPRGLRGLLATIVDDRGAVRWVPGVIAADDRTDDLPDGPDDRHSGPDDPADIAPRRNGPFVLRLIGSGGRRPLGYPPT